MMWLRLIAVLGACCFTLVWAGVVMMPKELERSAIGFVKVQITAEIETRAPALGPERMQDGLQALADRFGLQSARITQDLQGDLPEVVGAIVSGLCGCDRRTNTEIAAAVRDGMEARIAQLGVAQGTLAQMIKGRYQRIIAALRRDVMIFLGTNALAFMGVLAVTFIATPKKNLVIFPAILLLAAVGISTFIYVFNTNWFYAILFQNYWGYSYLSLMAVIFGGLIDIAMNRARITLQIVGNLPNALIPAC